MNYLLTVCSSFKNIGFEEEKEWRFIFLRDMESRENIYFRSGSKGIIPFCKFSLIGEENPVLADATGAKISVRVGPCINKDERGIALKMLFKEKLGIDYHPKFSDVPYQSW